MTTPVQKSPIWRNQQVRSWAVQVAVLFGVVLFISYLVSNFQSRTAQSPVELGFDFLGDRAGFEITGNSMSPNAPMWEAFLVGYGNTIRLVIPGLILTTVLGVLVGIGRLSKNWIVAKASSIYVEAIRNTPLLILIVITYFGFILEIFPRFKQGNDYTGWSLFGDSVLISRRGIDVPWFDGNGQTLALILLVGFVAWRAAASWRQRVSDRTGALSRGGLYGAGAFALVVLVGWFAFGFTVSTPELIPNAQGAINRATGGINMPASFLGILIALVIYTASHIAEIIRGSIQAVHKGQGEAASALALSNFQRMWYVVLPQALRIAIPPLGNQYLNLLKNSSLAGFVAYFDLFAVARTGVGGRTPAIPTFLVAMIVYLFSSLVISVLVNLYNRRQAYATR